MNPLIAPAFARVAALVTVTAAAAIETSLVVIPSIDVILATVSSTALRVTWPEVYPFNVPALAREAASVTVTAAEAIDMVVSSCSNLIFANVSVTVDKVTVPLVLL